jgi:hypothetical protein
MKQTSNKHQNDIYQMNEALSMRETDHKKTIVHRWMKCDHVNEIIFFNEIFI